MNIINKIKEFFMRSTKKVETVKKGRKVVEDYESWLGV